MAIIKCKMCGGDLNLIEGASTAECEFCGSIQTIPNLDDEKKLIQFERAERLRRQCEFDKAAGIYETIVADFRQEAEAYWGLVLCKFGIEYVDDPATGKKIPTCHRSSFDSILEDGDFEQALENADAAARKVYREEAKAIEEIRKGIIAVSSNEQPYDIFICYKETDPNGDRTLDSVLAQDVYDALTGKGYRVFFSRITLEDKLGMEYEPYIFAALNSAKIMLAFGTDYEYFNAVWVKNEWSRFLKLMAKDKDKHLIPCYKGIDAYDMPREFARLQAQDLGKVGAIQDLLRGVEKLLPRQQNTNVIQERIVVGGSGDNKIASLLDRGNMALEDGDWAKADSFFEDVLNNDSKNAQAYLGKTLAMEKCRTIDAFVRKRKDASQNARGQRLSLEPNHARIAQAAEKYGLPGFVEQEQIRRLYGFDLSYHSDVAERKQQYRNEENYWANHKQLSRAEKFAVGAVAESLAREKKALFAALADRVKKAEAEEEAAKKQLRARYEAHLRQMDEEAEKRYEAGLSLREQDYQQLLQTAKTSGDVEELENTARRFEALGAYQDSKDLAEHCRKRAAEEQQKLDEEAERQRLLLLRQEKERRAKAKRKMILSSCIAGAVILSILFVYLLNTVIIPSNNYNKALEQMEAGNYEAAIEMFQDLGGYKDSVYKILRCQTAILEQRYQKGLELFSQGEYKDAYSTFVLLETYRDSKSQAQKCLQAIQEETYQQAMALMDDGEYQQAHDLFETISGYSDAAEQAKEAMYRLGLAHWNAKDYDASNKIFASLGSYKDSADRIHTHTYETVVEKTPACEKTGTARFTCSDCGHNYTEEIPATGHDYSNTEIILAPSCKAKGEQKVSCHCGVSFTEPIEKTAHTYRETVTTAAGCETQGEKTITCTVCGDSYTEKINATGHTYQETVTTAAGCETQGVKTITCTGCGKSRTEAITANGHSFQAATCEAPKTCASCGKTEGSALGHKWEYNWDNTRTTLCGRCKANMNDKVPVTSNVPLTITEEQSANSFYDITFTQISYQMWLDDPNPKEYRVKMTVKGSVAGVNEYDPILFYFDLYDEKGNLLSEAYKVLEFEEDGPITADIDFYTYDSFDALHLVVRRSTG